jgi:hypothetical protein
MTPRGAPALCAPGKPLASGPVDLYRIGPGGRFDLRAWQGSGGIAYTLEAKDGVLLSSRESNY